MLVAHNKERATPVYIRARANQSAKHGWEYRWKLKNKVFGLFITFNHQFFNAIHHGVLIHRESTLKLPGTGQTLHLYILS